MVEDFVQLLQMALGLRPAGRRPLIACAVKQCGLRMKASIVGSSLGPGYSMHVMSVRSSAGHSIAAKVWRGESRCSGGWGVSRVIAPSKVDIILDSFVRKH
jgi:hypothetical protein